MAYLPIIRRELGVAARRTATYRNRVVFGALAVGFVAIQFLFIPQTRLKGAEIFRIMAWGGFLLCLFEGMRATADSISMERREGTLGLLLLTDVRGHHITAGKFASAVVQSLTTVVSMLPAFALPVLLGGVTAGECWRVMLALLAALGLALCAGTLVSSVLTGALAAFGSAVVAIAVFTVAPLLMLHGPLRGVSPLWTAAGGPLQMLIEVPDAVFAPRIFWLSSAVAVLVCVAMFVAAGWLLHRFPRLEARQTESAFRRWLRPAAERIETWGGASARSDPAVWLAQRTMPGRQALWVVILGGAVLCFFFGWFGKREAVFYILGCEVVFAFGIKLWLAAVAPLSLNDSRRGGALELLLCTPMRPAELVKGQIDALCNCFLGPALVIALGFSIVGIVGMGIGRNGAGMSADGSPFVFGLFWFVLFILDLHALAYTGLWNGLTTARLDRAIAKTVFAVLVLPWLTLLIPFVGCLGMIGWPVFWIYWSSGRLRSQFRREAVKQFSSSAEDVGWLPWSRKSAV